MISRRFPLLLFAAWAVLGLCLTLGFRHVWMTGNFPDTDDYMRLQQVRDLVAGQGWFDLTQHRVAPPVGLPMHWSRLVDIPLLLFLVPLTPLIGAHAAETVALIGAPLLTLLALMTAIASIVHRLHGDNARIILMGWLFAILPPLVFAQTHPGRIDHHGWQIALAAGVLAALLDARPVRSGIVAGLLTALFLAISIEGAPFALAAIGTVALLWALGHESGHRLTRYGQSLALCSIAANALLAPSARWTEARCDAVMAGHLAALVAAGAAITIAVRVAGACGIAARVIALALAAAAAIATLYAIAPACVGSPFGTMDPLVQRMWFENVNEGLPVWRQDALSMVAALGFPLIGVFGALRGFQRADTDESKRKWLLVTLLGALTLLTGALVFRAGGIAQIMAIPGALVLVESVVAWAGQRQTMIARVFAHAGAVLALSPIGPLVVAAMTIPGDDSKPSLSATKPLACDLDCAMTRLNARPPTLMMNEIDLGPVLISRTHHSAYVASYHRLQGPLADTIRFFLGSSAEAQGFMRANGLRYILIAPDADETGAYKKTSPTGFAAQLVTGKAPPWLRPVDYGGGKALLLFEVIER
jgi:hypothetical protein